MSKTLILVPQEDVYVVARLSQILAKRIVGGNDTAGQRQTLMRALFGLQRLPILIPNLSISICAGKYQLQIDSEYCGFISYTEDWHTDFRIEYFAASTHCIEGFETLKGEEKIAVATLRLDEFEAVMEGVGELSFEDHSIPGEADQPPINDHLEYARAYDEL